VSPTLISEDLAQFVGGFVTDRIPPPIVARAKYLILDAVGIALASTTYEFSQRALMALADLAGAGDAAVIGTPLHLPMRDAALINGMLIHGLDFDDTHSGGVIHYSDLRKCSSSIVIRRLRRQEANANPPVKCSRPSASGIP
jgi:2-methylcitrate dehydratase PrpD